MATQSLPAEIKAYNAAQETPALRRICSALAKSIDEHLPAPDGPVIDRKIWHRHPVWFLDGNPIVGYSTLKASRGSGPCIRLLFWSGQSFEEPGLAPAPPYTKFKSADARYITLDDINHTDLKRWLIKAADIQWDYKNIVKRKGKLVRLK